MEAALSCCSCSCSCCAKRFCSLSFWVSANFTTMGEEQPWNRQNHRSCQHAEAETAASGQTSVTSMVWDWCMDLMAACAICRAVNVTNAHPARERGAQGQPVH